MHRVSKRTVSENQAIILEDLNVQGLLKNGNLSRHVSNTSWSEFMQCPVYKARCYRRHVIFADIFYPSSRLCHICGYRKEDLTLSVRSWICPVCGTEHDRDVNAAKNLLNYGLIHLTDGTAGTVRTYACGGVKKACVKQKAFSSIRGSSSLLEPEILGSPVIKQLSNWFSALQPRFSVTASKLLECLLGSFQPKSNM